MNRKGQFLPLRDQNPTRTTPWVNWLLIAINVVVFIFTVWSLDAVVAKYGFTPAHISLLTILTSMFLHGGLAHIAGNMWFLYIFGDNVEDTFGHLPYLVFYLLAGVAATLLHLAFNVGSTIPSVGASGAISGVLGAYLVLFPNAGVYVSGQVGRAGLMSAKVMIGLWFLFQLAGGFLGFFGQQSGVAFWAHVGGFVFGAAIAWIWKKLGKKEALSSA